MVKDTTPSAQWDSMTDQQKIEWLATKVMGWEKIDRLGKNFWGLCHSPYKSVPERRETIDGIYPSVSSWNPLTDWNHCREIEKAIITDPHQKSDEYINALKSLTPFNTAHIHDAFVNAWCSVILQSDCKLRCKAAFLALQ